MHDRVDYLDVTNRLPDACHGQRADRPVPRAACLADTGLCSFSEGWPRRVE